MEWDVEAALEQEQLESRTADRDLILGRYRITHKLGSGGFGTVFAARDERLRRDVAVKVIPRADTDDDRAGREGRVAARLNHPNVVALYELGFDDDNVYLVSELVDGRTLAELIADDALSDRDIARIGAALCDGLAHAHERGVVHRDVKPGNVMVVAEPARGSARSKTAYEEEVRDRHQASEETAGRAAASSSTSRAADELEGSVASQRRRSAQQWCSARDSAVASGGLVASPHERGRRGLGIVAHAGDGDSR